MRVEAELEGRPVDEDPREDPVERCPRAERAPQQRLVRGASSGRTSGSGRRAARSTAASTLGGGAKQARGTRRARLSSYHAPQLQPSSVDGQTAVRFAASPHSTIASSCVSGTRGSPSRRRRIAVPTAKAGSRRPRTARRQRHQRRVAFDHLDTRIAAEARLELPQCSRVELDRAHAGARVGERARQRAAAGTEVEHERPGQDPSVADELVGEGATTKSVATARPRLR